MVGYLVFIAGLLLGIFVGLVLGNWLDQRDILYFCPRCRRRAAEGRATLDDIMEGR